MRGLFLLLPLSVTLGTGCALAIREPMYEAPVGVSTTFQGILPMAAKRGAGAVDVLMVHGMCTHDAGTAASAVASMVGALTGIPAKSEVLAPKRVEGTAIDIYAKELAVQGVNVRLQALVWSPVITPLKRQLCYDQVDNPSVCFMGNGDMNQGGRRTPSSAAWNGKLKEFLMDDCLADAIIYQGKSRDEISIQMQKAIVVAVGPLTATLQGGTSLSAVPSAQAVPLVVIAESLGSKIAFDAIYRLLHPGSTPPASLAIRGDAPATKEAGEAIRDRTELIFMWANQMPILALADQGLDGTLRLAAQDTMGYPADPIGGIYAGQARASAFGGSVASPVVVAFSDPNDILSYTLTHSHLGARDYPVIDVLLSNAPTVLGLLENPYAAHLGYVEQRKILELVVCGNSTATACVR